MRRQTKSVLTITNSYHFLNPCAGYHRKSFVVSLIKESTHTHTLQLNDEKTEPGTHFPHRTHQFLCLFAAWTLTFYHVSHVWSIHDLQLRRVSSIRHYLTSEATKTLNSREWNVVFLYWHSQESFREIYNSYLYYHTAVGSSSAIRLLDPLRQRCMDKGVFLIKPYTLITNYLPTFLTLFF